MSDLVERLRERLVMSMFIHKTGLYQEQERQRDEAADALTEQAAEIDRLKAALVEIRQMETAYANATVCRMAEKADAALGESK